LISRFERFSYAISRIYHYWHKIAAVEMANYGLKGPHAIYLVAMHRYPEGITAAQLCELCGKDKSDVSRAISLMEEKGLVRRDGTGQSMYRARLILTEDGSHAAEQVCRRAALAVENTGGSISEEHRAVLYKVLEQIAENLRIISNEGLQERSTYGC
jgi:DNA-binding MarR family transcriptional regulator